MKISSELKKDSSSELMMELMKVNLELKEEIFSLRQA